MCCLLLASDSFVLFFVSFFFFFGGGGGAGGYCSTSYVCVVFVLLLLLLCLLFVLVVQAGKSGGADRMAYTQDATPEDAGKKQSDVDLSCYIRFAHVAVLSRHGRTLCRATEECHKTPRAQAPRPGEGMERSAVWRSYLSLVTQLGALSHPTFLVGSSPTKIGPGYTSWYP